MRKAKWPGNWKVECHRCGWTFPSEDIRKEWTGLNVCGPCWEPKHPQLMIKIREETAHPTFVNKDSITTYISLCTIQTASSYADMATADCAQANWANVSYANLLALTTNGHE